MIGRLLARSEFARLPIVAHLEELSVGRSVVSAPPGTGKTTAVPPALAEQVAGRVIVTQPRRIRDGGASRTESPSAALSRDLLWELGETQHGFVTAQQAEGVGISKQALQMLVRRGTLERAAHGVYRLPRYPRSEHDHLMLAVLWTRVPEAALSHETALDAYSISDINPNRIHITVG